MGVQSIISGIFASFFIFGFIVLFLQVAYNVIRKTSDDSPTTFYGVLTWYMGLLTMWYYMFRDAYRWVTDKLFQFVGGFVIGKHYPVLITLAPMLLIWFIILMAFAMFWDMLIVPLTAILKDLLNILIMVWNMAALILSMFGIRMPRFSKLKGGVPKFWKSFFKFIKGLLSPLEILFRGWLIR